MTDVSPTRRLRFSLVNLLLLTTIAALAIVLWRQNSELAPLKKELRRLRNEVGHLVVDDPALLNAIRVKSASDSWRYRVWIPEGARFWLHCECSTVPQFGVPAKIQSGGSRWIEAGEHLVDVSVTETIGDRDSLLARIMVDGSLYMNVNLTEEEHDWINHDRVGGRQAGWSGVGVETETVLGGQPMVLLKLRARNVVNVQTNSEGDVSRFSPEIIPGACEGLLIWIDDDER